MATATMNFQELMLEAVEVKSFEDFKGSEDHEVLVRDSEGLRFGEVMIADDEYVMIHVQGRPAQRIFADSFELPEGAEIYVLPEGTNFRGF